MANAAGVILKSHIQVNQPVMIVCDIDQIYRLVSNLISPLFGFSHVKKEQ